MLKFANGHPLILGKGAFNDVAGLEIAHADVELVPGLGGAGGVRVLDQMRDVIQQQQHAAFEFFRQNSLHRAFVRPGAGVVAALPAPQVNGMVVAPISRGVNSARGASNAPSRLLAALNILQRLIQWAPDDRLICGRNRSLIPLSHGFAAHYRTGAAGRAA